MGLGFLHHMRVVPDHGIAGMVTYPLDEALLATLVGVVCGADDWEGVEEIARGRSTGCAGFCPSPVGYRLYLPKEWAEDEPRRQRPAWYRKKITYPSSWKLQMSAIAFLSSAGMCRSIKRADRLKRDSP